MKAIIFLLLAFCNYVFAAQQEPLPLDECKTQAPLGFPISKSEHSIQICRKAYLSTFNTSKKIPEVVSYVLTPEHALGCLGRSNKFAADKSLEDSPKPKDYAKSGYDMGHMMNDADSRWDLQVEEDSFILSNIAPQLPELNRREWKQLEDKTRIWAVERGHSLLIYVGTIGKQKTIKNGVVVPKAFFKVIIDMANADVMAFIFDGDGQGQLEEKLTSIAEIQNQSGLILPSPSYKKTILWDSVSKSNARAKSKVCTIH